MKVKQYLPLAETGCSRYIVATVFFVNGNGYGCFRRFVAKLNTRMEWDMMMMMMMMIELWRSLYDV
jgi:hypothetical protein